MAALSAYSERLEWLHWLLWKRFSATIIAPEKMVTLSGKIIQKIQSLVVKCAELVIGNDLMIEIVVKLLYSKGMERWNRFQNYSNQLMLENRRKT